MSIVRWHSRAAAMTSRAADILDRPTAQPCAGNVVPFRRPQRAARSGDAAPSELAALLQTSLDGRVVNHYQPQFDLATGRIVAVEALVRLQADSGELRYPDSFIAEMENSGMIVPLGRLVIRQACEDLARWRSAGLPVERVAINVSARQLELDSGMGRYIASVLQACGLSCCDLEFELTERQALQADGVGIATLTALAAAGARLALDDFGIGYSSLAYLTCLDVSTVKLDRSMVGRLPHDISVAAVVRHLTNLIRELGLTVVAEGIETREQWQQLSALGCQIGQGYLKGPPMDARELASRIRAEAATPSSASLAP